jgi:hypothetical protein
MTASNFSPTSLPLVLQLLFAEFQYVYSFCIKNIDLPLILHCHIRLIFCLCRYARQVAEFFEFVKKKKESPPEKTINKDRMNPRTMLPNGGHLWVPKGPFPGGSPMNMDFRRAMSSYLKT